MIARNDWFSRIRRFDKGLKSTLLQAVDVVFLKVSGKEMSPVATQIEDVDATADRDRLSVNQLVEGLCVSLIVSDKIHGIAYACRRASVQTGAVFGVVHNF